MEDGWILAQALSYFANDVSKALPLFNAIRLPYYSRMYEYLAEGAVQSKKKLLDLGAEPTFDEMVRNKVIGYKGVNMAWIYENDIAETWRVAVEELERR